MDDALCCASACHGFLAVGVGELGEGRGGDEERKGDVLIEDARASGDGANVAHETRTEVDGVEAAAVVTGGDAVGCCAGVEGPCFWCESALGDGLEVVGRDDGVQWWLFVNGEFGRSGWWWFGEVGWEFGGVEVADMRSLRERLG